MTNYIKLDALIVDAVRSGAAQFAFIHAGHARDEAERIARETKRDAYRVIDGRLQALRRGGVLAFTSKGGWHER